MKIKIIAEIGINHNGDIELAKKMISSAKNCGADIVKFQKRDINLVYSKEFLKEERKSPWGTTQLDQKKGLEFSAKEYDIIANYCKEIEIEWFASAWDINSLIFLDQYNFKYHKIASAMIVDEKFLDEVAKRKKHTFISTGMSSEENIEKAVEIFRKNECSFELMHCVSAYPFESQHANLQLINHMKKKYNCNVGYSGHEKSGLAISYAASALGITSLERHFTTDRTLYGSDQAASIAPEGFSRLVGGVREIEKAFSQVKKKEILEIEKPVAKKLREHLNL
ncbi:N-acetylneuraminate synthase family protein [Candidatus Pelagibacter sp.]|nr:N-acetylneuraminate synthase family protein [Candidatus Pelagibacter sp.]